MNAQLQFRDLTLGYDRHPAVHHLNGGIDAGALIAVVGPNGAGKSTLFKGIVGLLAPLAGRIELNGLKRRDIAYLPQVADIDRSFPINVYDMIAMGLWRLTGLFGGVGGKGRAQIHHAIEAVGLTGFEDRPIGNPVGRADAARAVRAVVAAGCAFDRARRAVQRGRCQDGRRSCARWCSAGTARNARCVAALHDLDLVRANFPEVLLLARAAGGVGPDGRCADAGQSR